MDREWLTKPSVSTLHEISADLSHILIGPDVPGTSSYNGTIAHSATWDPKISWEGKRVALIGTGSSSVQMLPQLAKGQFNGTMDLFTTKTDLT